MFGSKKEPEYYYKVHYQDTPNEMITTGYTCMPDVEAYLLNRCDAWVANFEREYRYIFKKPLSDNNRQALILQRYSRFTVYKRITHFYDDEIYKNGFDLYNKRFCKKEAASEEILNQMLNNKWGVLSGH